MLTLKALPLLYKLSVLYIVTNLPFAVILIMLYALLKNCQDFVNKKLSQLDCFCSEYHHINNFNTIFRQGLIIGNSVMDYVRLGDIFHLIHSLAMLANESIGMTPPSSMSPSSFSPRECFSMHGHQRLPDLLQ
jgi:hypothetical protein